MIREVLTAQVTSVQRSEVTLMEGDFPGGPVDKIQHTLSARATGSNCGGATKISLSATTEPKHCNEDPG